MSCGKIYLEVAEKCLENWYPDIPEVGRATLLAREDFDELESYIGAKDSIEAAVRGFNRGCHACNLPDYFFLEPERFMRDAIMDNQIQKWQNHLNKIAYSAMFKDPYVLAGAAVLALDEIHNIWVEKNTQKYFDESRKEKRFMFMPLPLIGWKEARKDLIFLLPLLNAMRIRLSEGKIKDEYERARRKFKSEDELTDFIMQLGDTYIYLDETIAKSIKDETTAREIASQCLNAA